uniref:Uncharacterized protein n=1 Tax=Anguilla anguilla TaxID=7936 RepID=A0A0E9UZQ0_ANGAN
MLPVQLQIMEIHRAHRLYL